MISKTDTLALVRRISRTAGSPRVQRASIGVADVALNGKFTGVVTT